MFGTASIPNRPTAKLVLTAVLFFIPAVTACLFGGVDAPISRVPIVVCLGLIFWAWWCLYAVFRRLGIQSLFGVMCLVIGLAWAAQILAVLVGDIVSGHGLVQFELSQLRRR
jgi:hypothetical protein